MATDTEPENDTNRNSTLASESKGRPKNCQQEKKKKKKHSNKVVRPPPLNLGVGTVGLGERGQSGGESLSSISYRQWLQEKKSSPGDRDQSTPRVTPRELYQEEKQKIVYLRERQSEHSKEMGAEHLKERQKHRELIMKEREEELEKLRSYVQRERRENEEKRELAISTYVGTKAGELRRERAKMREERESWRELLREEKEAEIQRVKDIRSARDEHHRTVSAVIVAEREERMSSIYHDKDLLRAKLDQWRKEREEVDRLRNEVTQMYRHRVEDSVRQSKEDYSQEVKEEAKTARERETFVKEEWLRRKDKHNAERQRDVVDQKEEQKSMYSIRLEELHHKRSVLASEVREATVKNRDLVQQEREERAEEAHSRWEEAHSNSVPRAEHS